MAEQGSGARLIKVKAVRLNRMTELTCRYAQNAVRALMAAALALVVIAQPAGAQNDRRVLVDLELRPTFIRLLSLSDTFIIYEDEHGRRRQATLGGVVAMLPDPTKTPVGADENQPEQRGFLELIDGQRFPGEHATASGDEDVVVWTHPAFGRISVEMDRVAQVVLDAGMRRELRGAKDERSAPLPATNDSVLLVNGDVLSGFLISLGNPVEIEVADELIAVAPERVAAARLANNLDRLGGLVVWLDDGTVAVVSSMASNALGEVSVTLPTGQSAEYPLDSVRAVAFEAGRLLPLATLAPAEQRAIDRRRLLDPVSAANLAGRSSPIDLNTPDLALNGPLVVSWELPAAARRFAALAEMPIDALPWGDCEIVVSIDGAERVRERLNQETRLAELSVELAPQGRARLLTIAILPGEFGPINDRVLLRKPLVLIDPE